VALGEAETAVLGEAETVAVFAWFVLQREAEIHSHYIRYE